MSKRFCIIALIAAALLYAQGGPGTAGYQFAIWDLARRTYVWPNLGKGFVLQGNTLDVVAAPARLYDVALVHDVDGWILPAGARNVVIHVNGLRYRAGVDYEIRGSKVFALDGNMQPSHSVTADYDQ